MVKESVSVTQTELDVEHAKPRAGDPHVLIADSTKFREATGWEPTYTTREMIETAYKAYRKASNEDEEMMAVVGTASNKSLIR